MSNHHDAHPYGRSGEDVRRRTLREKRLRRVRITQLITFSLLVILLVGSAAFALMQVRGPAEPLAAETTAAPEGCPAPGAVPAAPADVQVTVLNGTDTRGLAGTVTEELAARGYVTGTAGNTSDAEGPATVQYGPDGYLAAASVAAQVDGAVLQEADLSGTEVRLLIGEGWAGLRPADAATAALAEPVTAPEGCA